MHGDDEQGNLDSDCLKLLGSAAGILFVCRSVVRWCTIEEPASAQQLVEAALYTDWDSEAMLRYRAWLRTQVPSAAVGGAGCE